MGEVARWRRPGALLGSLGQALGERDGLRAELAAMQELKQHFRGLAFARRADRAAESSPLRRPAELAMTHAARRKSRLAVLYLDLTASRRSTTPMATARRPRAWSSWPGGFAAPCAAKTRSLASAETSSRCFSRR